MNPRVLAVPAGQLSLPALAVAFVEYQQRLPAFSTGLRHARLLDRSGVGDRELIAFLLFVRTWSLWAEHGRRVWS